MIDLSVYLVTDSALSRGPGGDSLNFTAGSAGTASAGKGGSAGMASAGTAGTSAAGRGVLDVVRAAVAGGATTVQLRDKQSGGADLFELLVRMAEIVDGRATVLINDHLDVFLAARAAGARVHGVHVGQADLPVRLVRQLAGPDAVVGLTANTAEHFAAAQALPAGTVDYLGVGVIRPTATKPNHPAPLGVDGFAALARSAVLPCVAIGGIGRADVGALRRAGAAGVAVVSEICAAPDPAAAARALADEWAAAGEPDGERRAVEPPDGERPAAERVAL